jgi:hypothetical protein
MPAGLTPNANSQRTPPLYCPNRSNSLAAPMPHSFRRNSKHASCAARTGHGKRLRALSTSSPPAPGHHFANLDSTSLRSSPFLRQPVAILVLHFALRNVWHPVTMPSSSPSPSSCDARRPNAPRPSCPCTRQCLKSRSRRVRQARATQPPVLFTSPRLSSPGNS